MRSGLTLGLLLARRKKRP